MRSLMFLLLILTSGNLFGQKSINGTSGLLFLEEYQGHVYEAYFLPNINRDDFKNRKVIDTIKGYRVDFIYGCVPDNDALRNDLRKMKALDSTIAISTNFSSQGQAFLDSTKIFSAWGRFETSDITEHSQTIRYQQFHINGRKLVIAIKGECTSRSFLSLKGRVSS